MYKGVFKDIYEYFAAGQNSVRWKKWIILPLIYLWLAPFATVKFFADAIAGWFDHNNWAHRVLMWPVNKLAWWARQKKFWTMAFDFHDTAGEPRHQKADGYFGSKAEAVRWILRRFPNAENITVTQAEEPKHFEQHPDYESEAAEPTEDSD